MRILVTGATGYIGERAVAQARQAGHDVVAATRNRPSDPQLAWVPFDLSTAQSFRLPPEVDAVVHLAAVTTASDITPEAEIAAAGHLIESARQAGARLIFISSQVARRDAPTPYGRIKWAIEQRVAAAGGVSIRPGQVYGGTERGLFGLLVRLVRALPVIPAFLPAPQIQPIHVDDLAHGILVSLDSAATSGSVLCLGSPEPVSFTRFLALIARQRLHVTRVAVPVPVRLVQLGVALLGKSLAARLGLDKLKSLFELPAMDTQPDLASLALTLRPIESGMARSGCNRRRQIAAEGTALLVYIMRSQPGRALIARYVRAIESLRGGESLGLPAVFLRFPAMLALLDGSSSRDPQVDEAGWRLGAAMTLAESTPAGALRFLGKPGQATRGTLSAMAGITLAVARSVLWGIARALVSPFMRLSFNRHCPARNENRC